MERCFFALGFECVSLNAPAQILLLLLPLLVLCIALHLPGLTQNHCTSTITHDLDLLEISKRAGASEGYIIEAEPTVAPIEASELEDHVRILPTIPWKNDRGDEDEDSNMEDLEYRDGLRPFATAACDVGGPCYGQCLEALN